MNFTESNSELIPSMVDDTTAFSGYISKKIATASAQYGIGGYDENRTVYSRSKVFDTGEEPRRLHLGIDIWADAGTPVFLPLDGIVHSFAYNNHFGDYGATIIIKHQLDGFVFHTLYGHLSLKDLLHLEEGMQLNAGRHLADFGIAAENGHWPPHLHFQLIIDMEGKKGDYPGVCKLSERAYYLNNCPDPDLILGMMRYAV
jgi:murein DD-endopeptidase MepM/ murein hydrolase activator NlpD